MIGHNYIYPNQTRKFKLVAVKGCIYHFECGHWVTDNVFADMICVDAKQLQLF